MLSFSLVLMTGHKRKEFSRCQRDKRQFQRSLKPSENVFKRGILEGMAVFHLRAIWQRSIRFHGIPSIERSSCFRLRGISSLGGRVREAWLLAGRGDAFRGLRPVLTWNFRN